MIKGISGVSSYLIKQISENYDQDEISQIANVITMSGEGRLTLVGCNIEWKWVRSSDRTMPGEPNVFLDHYLDINLTRTPEGQ
jgi:hypothetical protein